MKLYARNRSLGLLTLPQAATKQSGWLVNNSQFSDAMSTLLFEFPASKLPMFLARFANGGKDDDMLCELGLSLGAETEVVVQDAVAMLAGAEAGGEPDAAGQAVSCEVAVLMSASNLRAVPAI